jgi:hypothetical protein
MSFKVIDGGGPGKEERDKAQEERDKERQREWATSEFSWAIRETAANMLRIIRGAGKPYELLMQMKKTIDSAIKFQEIHGYWPNDVMANELRLQDETDDCLERGRSGALALEHIYRWTKDGTFEQMSAEHTLYRGVLQIIASRMIGQNTQERAGDSEFHQGLRELEEIREKRRRKYMEEQRASRPAPRRTAPKKRKLSPRKPPGDIVL